jgi:Integral membrane protein TerC family
VELVEDVGHAQHAVEPVALWGVITGEAPDACATSPASSASARWTAPSASWRRWATCARTSSSSTTPSAPTTAWRPAFASSNGRSARDAFIVFAANAFALLGLRALDFLVTGLLDRLVYLSSGLSLILLFIGVKLLLHFGHLQSDDIPEIATSTSLLVILGIIAVTVVASLLRSRREPDARAHAGSLRATRAPEPRPAGDA